MPTTFALVKKDDTEVLRHGHASITDLNKVQWHEATQVHRNDPDGHDREDTWTNPKWSTMTGVHWRLTEEQRDELLSNAKDEHDAIRDGRAYHKRPGVSITPVVINTQVHAPQVQSTPARSSEVDELADRLNDLEGLHIIHDSIIKDHTNNLKLVERGISDLDNSHQKISDELNSAMRQLDHAQRRIKQLEDQAEKRIVFEVRNGSALKETRGLQHFMFPSLLALATSLSGSDRNIWISGPAGSGKTTAARKLAEALEASFDFHGAIYSPFKLSGYKDAAGVYQSTQFRQIYEHGGVILLDECDASSAEALLEINAALANSFMSFPDRSVTRHDNCWCIAAGNTWGFGGDANYIGRNKLDAAFMDRFVTLSWPYDVVMEASVIGARTKLTNPLQPEIFASEPTDPDEWVEVVQSARQAAYDAKAQIVISPRATIKGMQLLAAGLSRALVCEAIFARYKTHSTWEKGMGAVVEKFARSKPSRTHAQPVTNSKLTNLDFSGVKVF